MEIRFDTIIEISPDIYSITKNVTICTAIINDKHSSYYGQTCGRHTKCGNRCGYHKNQ